MNNALRILFLRGAVGRAALSSLVATLCDYGVFLLLVGLSVQAGVSTFAGCVVGGIVNFTVNRYWAFGAGGKLGRAVIRYAAVSGSSAVSNAVIVAIATALLGLSATPAWVVARALVFLSLTYPLFRTWVFGTPRPLDLAPPAV